MSIIYATSAYVLTDFDARNTPPPLPPSTYEPPEEPPDPVFTEIGPPTVMEYGDPNSIIHNNDPLHVYIRYPQAGNPADEPVERWARDFYNNVALNYYTEVPVGPTDFGEINIQFNSYLIDNRYVGIHQFGEFGYHAAGEEQEILKTFNIDLTRFELLEPGDILNIAEPDAVLSLLSLRLLVEHPRTDGHHIYMDESWLSYLLITHEGIKVFLPHAEFLPDSFPSLTVLLPYEDLGTSLLIRQGAPLPEMPVPTPEPTIEPDPTPTPEPGDGGEGGEDGGEGGEDGGEGGEDGGEGGEDGGEGGEGGEDGGEGGEDGGEDGGEGSEEGGEEGGEGGETDPGDGSTDGGEGGEEPPPTVPPQSGPIDTSRPVIALSFDDGPGIYTDEILDLLEQYGVRATFFTVGNLVHTEREALKRAIDIGCEVAGQSWNHKNLAKMTEDDVKAQLEATQAAIEAATGVTVPMFRPPYGAVSDTMKAVCEELGLAMVTWNIDPEDWKNDDPDAIYDRVMEQMSDRSIIISHELYESTLEAYKRIIPELLTQGYQIVTVSELLAIKHMNLTPGQIYFNGN